MLIEDIVVSGAGGGWNGYMVNGTRISASNSEPVAAVDEYSIRPSAPGFKPRVARSSRSRGRLRAPGAGRRPPADYLHWGEPTAASMLFRVRQGSRVAELSQTSGRLRAAPAGKYPNDEMRVHRAQKQSVTCRKTARFFPEFPGSCAWSMKNAGALSLARPRVL